MNTRKTYDKLTHEELNTLVRSRNIINLAIASIFVFIIVVWIIFGIWKENMLLFIATIAMSIGISAALYATSSGLRKELRKRKNH